jgi:hypothetical protein
VDKEIKKRKFFNSLERVREKQEKEKTQTKLGEKSESEFKSYGVNCNQKKRLTPKDLKRVRQQKLVDNWRKEKFLTERKETEIDGIKRERFEERQRKNIVVVINGRLVFPFRDIKAKEKR